MSTVMSGTLDVFQKRCTITWMVSKSRSSWWEWEDVLALPLTLHRDSSRPQTLKPAEYNESLYWLYLLKKTKRQSCSNTHRPHRERWYRSKRDITLRTNSGTRNKFQAEQLHWETVLKFVRKNFFCVGLKSDSIFLPYLHNHQYFSLCVCNMHEYLTRTKCENRLVCVWICIYHSQSPPWGKTMYD